MSSCSRVAGESAGDVRSSDGDGVREEKRNVMFCVMLS